VLAGHTMAFSPDGQLLALGYSNGLVRLLLEFGERLDLVLWETCHIYATCQAYRAEADFQQLWSEQRQEYCSVFDGHAYSVNAVSFSPDGRFLVSASNDVGNQPQPYMLGM